MVQLDELYRRRQRRRMQRPHFHRQRLPAGPLHVDGREHAHAEQRRRVVVAEEQASQAARTIIACPDLMRLPATSACTTAQFGRTREGGVGAERKSISITRYGAGMPPQTTMHTTATNLQVRLCFNCDGCGHR